MNFKGTKAIYLQIADYIAEQILLKNLKPKEKVTSVRELAVNLEVNPNTVMRAYSFLEKKGVIVSQRGLGYFVTEEAYQLVIAFKKSEFLTHDWPQIMYSMKLLQINFEEMQKLYHDNCSEIALPDAVTKR